MVDVTKFNSYCNSLTLPNKVKRRKGLDGMLEEFRTFDNLSQEELEKLFRQCDESLISLMSDESEVNRNKSCMLLNKFVSRHVISNNLFTFAMPVLTHRLGGNSVIEASEENRLEFLCLLENLILLNNEKLNPFLDNINSILSKSLHDNYPDVIMKVCCIIELLPKFFKTRFPMFSNGFIESLLKNMNKKYKIRAKTVHTLSCIFLYGDCHDFPEASAVLLKWVSDIYQVRMAILTCGYSLACEMPDRYSYWPKILPLLLFGLCDEDHEINEAAMNFWNKVGLQYEKENHGQLPKKLEVSLCPKSYNIGCCALLKRSFNTMLHDIDDNIHDWQATVRLQAIRLLFTCIVGLEDNSIQYSDKILKLILSATADQDPKIASEALICAEYLGYHLPPDLYVCILKPFLWEERDEALSILSLLLLSTNPDLVKKHLSLFFDALNFSNIYSSVSKDKRNAIFEIINILFVHYFPEQFNTLDFLNLFYITGSTSRENELHNIMEIVCKNFNMNSIDDFFENYVETFLVKLKEFESQWMEGSPELIIFSVLAGCKGFDEHLKLVSSILKSRADVSSTDAVVLFRVLHSLEKVIKQLSTSGKVTSLEKWSTYFITEHINKHLPWKAGKTAQNLRMTALSYLNSVTQITGSSEIYICSTLHQAMQLLPELITDELPETRILSCKFIEYLNCFYKKEINTAKYLSLLELMIKRLDDKHAKVRSVAAFTITILSDHVPYEPDFCKKVESLVEEIAVFAKDDEVETCRNIFVTLKNIGKIYPEAVKMDNLKLNPQDLLYFEQVDNLQNMKID